jgi:DNA-binding Lrp family transcriptional regulator
MPDDTRRANGSIVRDLLSVATLLENPQLAGLYAYLCREGSATVHEVMDARNLSQETVHRLMARLEQLGVVEAITTDELPTYQATRIELSLSSGRDERTYTVTPALIDAVGRRRTDGDIDTYIDRHGVDGLATALTYTVDRERARVNHRLMARDLDITPLEAEIILQALRPVVHEYFEIEITDDDDVFEP